MEIVINGEPLSVTATTLSGLLQTLDLDPVRLAVERNRVIVPKAEYSTTTLSEGDRLEIVHFVGGG